MDTALRVVEPRYRSAAERRIASEIMAQEGSWDESAQMYHTKESLLQRRTHVIGNMHRTLRISPDLLYSLQSQNRDFIYPQCPKQLLSTRRTKPSELDAADPSPDNIERTASVASERRSQPLSRMFTANRVSTDEAIEELESLLLNEARGVLGPEYSSVPVPRARSPHTSSLLSSSLPRGGNHTPSFTQPARTGDPGTDDDADGDVLPEIGSGGPHKYSSMLVELQTTRRKFKGRSQSSSALHSILSMDASAEFKRTITRMFADPKNAQRISQEEHERREQRYQEERKQQTRQQMALLMEERALLDRELALLR